MDSKQKNGSILTGEKARAACQAGVLHAISRLVVSLSLPLVLALAALTTPAAAAPEPTLRFEHLSVQQGLSQESVLSIVQDRDGFMWFGTQSGLSR
ncbi:two-component regulator propeller domain-containing protein [Massilia oculi]|uniref:two-component regulator propeller domain-containing protein n=1 Tax=Massilia oculi TaxID=945844 RepID=UPI0028ADE9D6|nr:two-component regulator propeller domain-containing protein [Massilia oculi]